MRFQPLCSIRYFRFLESEWLTLHVSTTGLHAVCYACLKLHNFLFSFFFFNENVADNFVIYIFLIFQVALWMP